MQSLKEAGKELLRLILLTIVGYLLSIPTESILVALNISMTPEQQVLLSGFYFYALKGLDKFLHERGKEIENNSMIKGITRF